MRLYFFVKKELSTLKLWQKVIALLVTLFHIIMLTLLFVDVNNLNSCTAVNMNLSAGLAMMHIFSATNPLFVRVLPIQFFLLSKEKKKIWEIETLSVYNTLTCAGLSTFMLHMFILVLESGNLTCGCKFYPLILAAILTCFHMAVAIFMGFYFIIKISRNFYRTIRILCNLKTLDSKIRKSQSLQLKNDPQPSNKKEILNFIDESTRKGKLTFEKFQEQVSFLKIQSISNKQPLCKLFLQKFAVEDHDSLILSLLNNRKRVGLYKSKVTIPQNVFDPRAYALIRILSMFDAHILNTEFFTVITNFYWKQIRRTQTTKMIYTWGLSIIIILYALHAQYTYYAVEVGTLLLLFYSWSYEWIEMATNPNLNFYRFEHFVDIMIRFLTTGHIIAVWVNDSFRSEVGLSSLIIFFCCLKVGFTLRILEPVERFFLFLDQLGKDLAGLALVLVLFVIGFTFAFNKVQSGLVFDPDTGSTFTFGESINYVALRVTGGFDGIPSETGTVYAIVYFAIIILPVILVNSVVAVQSDTWVFVKENYRGVLNLDKIWLMHSYLNTKKMKISESSPNLSFYWYGDSPEGDPEPEQDDGEEELIVGEVKRRDYEIYDKLVVSNNTSNSSPLRIVS